MVLEWAHGLQQSTFREESNKHRLSWWREVKRKKRKKIKLSVFKRGCGWPCRLNPLGDATGSSIAWCDRIVTPKVFFVASVSYFYVTFIHLACSFAPPFVISAAWKLLKKLHLSWSDCRPISRLNFGQMMDCWVRTFNIQRLRIWHRYFQAVGIQHLPPSRARCHRIFRNRTNRNHSDLSWP